MNAKALTLLLLSTAAIASDPTTKVTGTLSVFHAEGKDAVTLRDTATKTAHDQCFEAAKAFPGKSSCSDVFAITTTPGDCTGVAKPDLPRTLDADGFVVKPPIRGKEPTTGNDWLTEIQDYVPAPYPTCWVLGWREITDADVNETDEDGPAVIVAETWNDYYQALWDNPVSVAARALP